MLLVKIDNRNCNYIFCVVNTQSCLCDVCNNYTTFCSAITEKELVQFFFDHVCKGLQTGYVFLRLYGSGSDGGIICGPTAHRGVGHCRLINIKHHQHGPGNNANIASWAGMTLQFP